VFLPNHQKMACLEIGSGNRVILGHDPFIGCNSSFKLSGPLIQFLNSLSIYSIAQAVVLDEIGSNQRWLRVQSAWTIRWNENRMGKFCNNLKE
jgi:hypothetical protein